MKTQICKWLILFFVLITKHSESQSIGGTLLGSMTVCSGNNNGILNLSGYSGAIVRWEFASAINGPWSIMVHNANSYNYINLIQTTHFRAVVQKMGYPEAFSIPASINCSPPALAGLISASTLQCISSLGTASIDLQIGNNPTWQISTDNWISVTNFGVSNSTFVTLPLITGSASIRASVKNGACPAAYSNTLDIFSVPQAISGTISGNAVVCSGISQATLTLNGFLGSLQQWENALSANGPFYQIPNSNTRTITTGNLLQANYYRAKVESGNCTPVFSNTFLVQANAQSLGGYVFGTGTVCAGANSGSLQLIGAKGSVNQWEYSINNGSNWQAINNTSSILNFSNINNTRIYRAVVQSGICPATTSQQFSLTVFPAPISGFIVNNACVNSPIQFTNTSTGFVTSIWNFNDGNGSMSTNPIHTYTSVGNYVTKLKTISNMGCTDSISQSVISHPNPSAAFVSDDTTCHSNSVQFTDNSSIVNGNISNLIFDFSDLASTSNLNSVAHLFSTSGNYSVKLKTWSNFGCTDSMTKTVRVFPKPNASFQIQNTCLGEIVSVVNSSTLSAGQLFHLWSFGNGDTSVSATPLYSYLSPGNYTFALFSSTEHNCRDTALQAIVIHPKHQINFTAPANNCQSAEIQFNVSYGNTIPLKSGKIYFGDGDSSSIFSNKHIYNYSGVYTASVVLVSDSGCIAAAQKNLTISPKPQADFTTQNICQNDSAFYQNLSNSNSSACTYLWRFTDGFTSTLKSPSHKYLNAGPKNVQVSVTTDKGCMDSLEQIHQVYELPLAGFSAANICQHAAQTFTNTSISNSSSLTYNWVFGDATISNERIPSKAFAASGIYNIKLTTTNYEGCKDTASQNVSIYEMPVANFLAQDVCLHESSTFKNSSSLHTNAYESFWSFGDEQNSNQNSPQHMYTHAGKFTIVLLVKTLNNCRDSMTKDLFVRPLPSVLASADSVIEKGTECKLFVTGARTYSWLPQDFLDNPFSQQPICSATSDIKYLVIGQDDYGCTFSDSLKIKVLNNYKIHPFNILTPDNNGKNDTWIIGNIEEYPDNKVSIFNQWNELIYEKTAYKNEWGGLNLNNEILPDGTYYYIIKFDTTNTKYSGYITLLRQSH